MKRRKRRKMRVEDIDVWVESERDPRFMQTRFIAHVTNLKTGERDNQEIKIADSDLLTMTTRDLYCLTADWHPKAQLVLRKCLTPEEFHPAPVTSRWPRLIRIVLSWLKWHEEKPQT